MNSRPIRAFGIPWYRREDYPAIRRVMIDGDRLPATYDAWLGRAKKVVKQIERQGGIAVQAYIDPTAFPEWCASRGLNVDAAARMQYASHVAFERHGGTH